MSEKKTFWGKLRQRHVVRAAIAHIILFWLLMQIADVVLPYIGIYDDPVRWTLMVGVALFPITLIVAWYFEHPWHTFTGSRLALDIAIIAIIGVMAASWVLRNLPQAVYTRTSIVVLPFTFDEDVGQTVSRALAYEINSLLLKSGTIDVIGFETAVSALLSGIDNVAIASKLDVRHVLAGTISSIDGALIVDSQLFDSDGNEIWGNSINDQLDNLFHIQERIASSVMIELGGGDAASEVAKVVDERCEMPVDTSVMDHYYTARQLYETRGESSQGIENLEQSISLFETLVAERPDFAQARSGLAWAYWVYPAYGEGADRAEWHEKSQTAARIAYKQCDTLGEALVLLPNEYDDDNEWINNEQNLAAAIQMEPGKTELVRRYSNHLRDVGRLDEATQVARDNYRMNPLSAKANTILAGILQYRLQFDESSKLYETAAELGYAGPNYAEQMQEIFACSQDWECIANMLPPPLQPYKERMVVISQDPVSPDDADAKIADAVAILEETTFVNWFNSTACWFDYLTPLFYETWEYSKRSGEFWYWPNVFHATCGNVWTSAEFPAFAEEVGFTEYWRKFGWPDMCEADGDGMVCHDDAASEQGQSPF